jgi:serine/threonine-protein kinase
MLDGTGKVRVMDFSLAAVGNVTDVRAGTPAYMAPEQLAGQEVTVRSDVYALGLVLYEIFTGRRAFEAKTLSELIAQHQAGAIAPPTAIVRTLDPAIETAVMRCLDPDPAKRPVSAIRVSAALPGGDLLAAALAAGETPSPEMVAAAGGDTAMISSVEGAAWLAVVTAIVITIAALAGRYSIVPRVGLTKPAAVLADRAEELRQSLGFADPPTDRAWDFSYDTVYLDWAEKHGSGSLHWPELAAGRPAIVRFWYRTSPEVLIPFNDAGGVTLADPPLQTNGMTTLVLDTKGRLVHFESAPAQIESPATAGAPGVDWQKLFTAAGLDRSAFAETAPARTPSTYSDERRAWTGTLPGTQTPVRIEAAGYRGRPVLFEIVGAWSPAAREPGAQQRNQGNSIIVLMLLAAAAFAAYANVRRGRADKRGAFRLGTFTFFMLAAIWLIGPHVKIFAVEEQRMFVKTGLALFVAGALYLLYLGLEPFVRRAWPSMLLGWSRLLSGRIRDPLVGRDVLVGVGCGAVLALLELMTTVLPPKLGLPEPQPHATEFGVLMGARPLLYMLLGCVNIGLQNAMITVFEFSALRAVIESATRGLLGFAGRRWAKAATLRMNDKTSERVFVALAVAMVTILSFANNDTASQHWLNAAYQAISTTLVLLVLVRIGIFASTVMFFTNAVLLRTPLTLDASAIYAGEAWLIMAVLLAIAGSGFWMARQNA